MTRAYVIGVAIWTYRGKRYGRRRKLWVVPVLVQFEDVVERMTSGGIEVRP